MTLDTATYARARAAGMPARHALGLARAVGTVERATLPDYGAPVTIKRNGWTLRLSVDYDEGLDLADMGYGTFVAGAEDWRGHVKPTQPGAIPNPRRDSRNPSNGAAFYVPSQDRAEMVAYYNGPTFGASRAVALDLARAMEADELARATDDYGPTFYVLTVEAMRGGLVLGSASLGGCEVGWDDITRTDGREYLAESYDDLIAEAIGEARDALARLCAPQGCDA